MNKKTEHELNKANSGSVKGNAPSEKGGSQQRKAQEWGGGSKASKGDVSKEDRQNQNSSQKS